MWTATVLGFFSVVHNAQVKGDVLVRARCKADIYNLYRRFSTAYPSKKGQKRFEMTRPKADEKRDYRWRISMKQRSWAEIQYKLAMAINYSNFKNEVHRHKDQDNKSSAYLTIWSTMYRVQKQETGEGQPIMQTRFVWPEDGIERQADFDEPAKPTKTIKSVTHNTDQAML